MKRSSRHPPNLTELESPVDKNRSIKVVAVGGVAAFLIAGAAFGADAVLRTPSPARTVVLAGDELGTPEPTDAAEPEATAEPTEAAETAEPTEKPEPAETPEATHALMHPKSTPEATNEDHGGQSANDGEDANDDHGGQSGHDAEDANDDHGGDDKGGDDNGADG